MTRNEFHKILKTPISERQEKGLPIFEWEHWSKTFQYIPNDIAIKHLMEIDIDTNEEDRIILKCKSKNGVYYFGVGLKDCDSISLKKLKELYKNGVWSVYTWCD